MSSSPIDQAAAALRRGEVVAFPTETVYGLGADAQNLVAVARIFSIKGRPADHPLIVHIAGAGDLPRWAGKINSVAERLARAFWPGPLTLVLDKTERVPLAVTGGLPTVAVRVPAHPLALELLRAFGSAIAAPSANRFGAVSPTTADHVRRDLGTGVDFVLDGGPCAVGLESTIVDVSGSGQPAILRPGGITREDIERVLGGAVALRTSGDVRAPGTLPTHYSPRARVILAASNELAAVARGAAEAGQRVGILALETGQAELAQANFPPSVLVRTVSGGERGAAHDLYALLREFDDLGCDTIVASLPGEIGLGLAIADRLRRAAGPRE